MIAKKNEHILNNLFSIHLILNKFRKVKMKNNGQTAPEFEDLQGWINSEPLTLAGLYGKIVFLDFWTLGLNRL